MQIISNELRYYCRMLRTKVISNDSKSMNLVTTDKLILGVKDNEEMEKLYINWHEEKMTLSGFSLLMKKTRKTIMKSK